MSYFGYCVKTMLRREGSGSRLYLGMAIRAKQDDFAASSLIFCIERVKPRLEMPNSARQRAVVPAQDARAAGLFDEEELCAAPPFDHALLPALLAAVVAAPFEDELGQSRVEQTLVVNFGGRPAIPEH